MKKQYVWIIVTCIWIGIIFSFSLQPGEISGDLSESFLIRILAMFSPELLNKPEQMEILHTVLRKCAHFSEYFILGIFSSQIFFQKGTKKRCLFGMFLSLAVAFVDESIQYFVPERAAKILDVMLDGTGALIGILMVVWISYIYEKTIKKTSQP